MLAKGGSFQTGGAGMRGQVNGRAGGWPPYTEARPVDRGGLPGGAAVGRAAGGLPPRSEMYQPMDGHYGGSGSSLAGGGAGVGAANSGQWGGGAGHGSGYGPPPLHVGVGGGLAVHSPMQEIKSGWLLKKAESSWGWRKRWFALYPGRLTYQASPDVNGVAKTIPLLDARQQGGGGVATVESLPSELEFRLHSFGRSFHLKAASAGERSQWIFAFELVLGGLVPGGGGGGGGGSGGGSEHALTAAMSPQSPSSDAGGVNASLLKRKLAEALPWDASRGPPVPALSSPTPSREGSLHGSESGWGGRRSRDGSLHNQGGGGGGGWQVAAGPGGGLGPPSGGRSREGSAHGGGGMPERGGRDDPPAGGARDRSGHGGIGAEACGPPGSPGEGGANEDGKRVKKDGEALSRTLFSAGQQARPRFPPAVPAVSSRGSAPDAACPVARGRRPRAFACPSPVSPLSS